MVQRLAESFFTAQPTVSDDEKRILHRIQSFDPAYALTVPYRLDRANDAQAAADAWEAALTAGDHGTIEGLDEILRRSDAETPDGLTLIRAAVAMARAGRIERAEALQAQADAKLGPETAPAGAVEGAPEAAPAQSSPAQSSPAPSADNQSLQDARRAQIRAQLERTLATNAAPYRPLLRAMLKSAHGDDAGALAIMQANFDKLPKVMASAELLQHLSQAPQIGAQVPGFLVQSATASARPDLTAEFHDLNVLDWLKALPQFERVDGGAQYRPGHEVGYHEAALTGDQAGQVLVTYSGATAYAGPEMVMLRAAQAAQERHLDGFVVLAKNGASLRVIFAAPDQLPQAYTSRRDRFIHAADVMSNLGPIYIDIPAAIDAARGH
jgi:hypothetical protein